MQHKGDASLSWPRRIALGCIVLIGLGTIVGSGDPPEPPPPPAPETRTINISSYGQGDVADSTTTIPCDSHNCSKEYTLNSKQVLTAKPRAGWTFERWTGCDSVSEAQCTVAMNKDRYVMPVFLRAVTTTLHADVVTLGDADMAAIVKNEAGVLTISRSSPSVANWKVGNIIHSAKGEGLARRVASVVALPGGNYIIGTTDVAITDVVTQGSFYFNSLSKAATAGAGQPRANALGTQSPPPGAMPLANWDGGLDVKTELAVDIPIDAEHSIKGSIGLTVNMEAGADISFPGVLNEFRLVVNPTVEPNLSVVFNLGKLEGSTPIGVPIRGAPIVMGPIVLVPEFVLKVTYKGTVEVEVNFVSSFKSTATAGFAYVKGYGVNPIWTWSVDPSPFRPAGKGSIELDVMGGLETGVKIWGVAGPKATVGSYLNVAGQISSNDACAKVQAEIGFRAKVGAQIQLLSWKLSDWEWTVAELPVATLLDKPLTRGCLPAPPTGIVVNSVDPHTLRLNWTAPASTERVVSYDLYRQGRMFTRISRLGIDDAGLEAGTEYCYDVRSRNLDGNVSVAGTPVCRTTRGLDTAAPSVPTLQAITPLSTTAMRVSWAASGDDSAVSGYTVLVNGVAVRSVADTKVDILRLNAGTQYCFKVRAYDSSGNFSADSAQACGVTLPPALAAWTMLLRCADRPDYVVSKGIDIDLQAPNNVSVAGQAVDYTGTLMSYHLFGGYDSTVGILLGKIDWTFANSSNVREDDFSLRLQTADTGDVPMTQVKVAGCNATIRLKRN